MTDTRQSVDGNPKGHGVHLDEGCFACVSATVIRRRCIRHLAEVQDGPGQAGQPCACFS